MMLLTHARDMHRQGACGFYFSNALSRQSGENSRTANQKQLCGNYRDQQSVLVSARRRQIVWRVVGSGDAELLSTTHGFQIGLDDAANLIFDNNEIMARNNGSPSNLNLNIDGGIVNIGASSSQTTVRGLFTSNELLTASSDAIVEGDLSVLSDAIVDGDFSVLGDTNATRLFAQ
ncbi:MAG: hypothetical protein U5K75_12105 [Ahrensia sp.]|nr:hypothetical protein [Ahrensia sp.]